MKPVTIIALLGFSLLISMISAPAWAISYPVAVLQGLDKITGRISKLYVPVNRDVKFGTLTITARACDKKPPEETPEKAAFLEIFESSVNGESKGDLVNVFNGWMFASSPSISALEHPVYDVWVIDCSRDVISQPSGSGSE